ncbi:unnamed protein product [Paramecium primaurelia]|uniref:FHA domain-containing protein n=2 Tax=Paramecium TaxID=5884 RepID=A0A8S1YBB7_9CILI|nr:unnamed protein product [Paramecium primaurelia]CAD8211050.1 unnamed protein product [Paramecium pentaurelia]
MGKHKQRSTSGSSSNHKKHKRKHHHQKKEVKQEVKQEVKKEEFPQQQQQEIIKEKPCFEASGILAQYAENALGNGKVLKFTIPFDAKIPTANWQLFPFKGTQSFPSIPLKGKSVFLIGKDKEIVDILIENISVSKQHCVIQFREIKKVNGQGEVLSYIKPYAMDLESTNGTYLNEQQLEPARYYELLEEDVLRFGKSDREYVLIKS